MLYLQNWNNFFKTFFRNTSHIPENELSRINIKLRNSCEKYCTVKFLYKYRDFVSKMSKREHKFILKQDEGRGVVVMDRDKYTNKSLALLSTKQFTTQNN